ACFPCSSGARVYGDLTRPSARDPVSAGKGHNPASWRKCRTSSGSSSSARGRPRLFSCRVNRLCPSPCGAREGRIATDPQVSMQGLVYGQNARKMVPRDGMRLFGQKVQQNQSAITLLDVPLVPLLCARGQLRPANASLLNCESKITGDIYAS